MGSSPALFVIVGFLGNSGTYHPIAFSYQSITDVSSNVYIGPQSVYTNKNMLLKIFPNKKFDKIRIQLPIPPCDCMVIV